MRVMLTVLFAATFALIGVGCGGGGRLPDEVPDYFTIEMTMEGYPNIVRARIFVRGDGSGEFERVAADGHGSDLSGQLELAPEDVAEIYAAVRDARFYSLNDEYIADPPLPNRGRDQFTVKGGGPIKVVRSEYASVEVLESIKEILMAKVDLGTSGPTTSGDEDGVKVIGDSRTKTIYPVGAPEIEAIPEASRVEFATYYDALDRGYHPASSADFPDDR